MSSINTLLYELYYGEGEGAFGSASKLYSAAKKHNSLVTYNQVLEFLKNTFSYNLYREKNKISRFKKSKKFRRFMTFKPSYMWVVDSMYLSSFRRGFEKFAFIFVDIFSRKCYAHAFRILNSKNAAIALELSIEDNDGVTPQKLLSDNGSEYLLNFTHKCNELGIELIRTSVNQPSKTAIAERKIRTLRKYMGRILTSQFTKDIKECLKIAVKITNATKNRSIGMKPNLAHDSSSRYKVLKHQKE